MSTRARRFGQNSPLFGTQEMPTTLVLPKILRAGRVKKSEFCHEKSCSLHVTESEKQLTAAAAASTPRHQSVTVPPHCPVS
jgi:hypothetical protein